MADELDKLYEDITKVAQNHIDRAEEGHRLLQEGRPLSEMTIEPIGLTNEQLLQRREMYLDFIAKMSTEKLEEHLKAVNYQIQRRLQDPLVGTSELEWQRINIEMLLAERNLPID
jgi:hypothetical protein